MLRWFDPCIKILKSSQPCKSKCKLKNRSSLCGKGNLLFGGSRKKKISIMLSYSGSPVLQHLIHGVFIPFRKCRNYNWSFLEDNTVKHSLKRMRKAGFQVTFHFFGCFLKQSHPISVLQLRKSS